MKSEHKFLAYKSAFTLNYKAGNFITASHFARQVIDLESSGVSVHLQLVSLPRLPFLAVIILLFYVLTIVAFEQIVSQDLLTKYKKYYQACQQKGSNANKLRFDPQDSVRVTEIMDGYLCAGMLSHLEDNRSVASVKCPLCSSVYARATFDGVICQTCQLCTLGQDALGLSIQLNVAPGSQ